MSDRKVLFSLRSFVWLTIACVLGCPQDAHATVLTFDQDTPADFDNVDLTYGDDVEAILEGGFGYGVGPEGFTPNVQLSYGSSDPSLWTAGYGNLTNVLFENTDSTGVLTITLDADPGFLVQLHEFDAAAFSSDFAADPTIAAVRVSSPAGVQFELLNASISETTSTLFDFTAAPLTGSQLVLEIDATNLGTLNDSIAVDNLRFGQIAIPEPASSALVLLACLLGVGGAHRR